jgi:SMI1 / KNR4 family (SUKH-1)
MNKVVQEFLSHSELGFTEPASNTDIDEVEKCFGITVPNSLRQLWQASGKTVVDYFFVMMHPQEILDEKRLAEFGHLPIVSDNNSNYLLLQTHSPLAPRIIHFEHDGDTKIIYKSFDSFLKNLTKMLDAEDFSFDEFDLHQFVEVLENDYPTVGKRSKKDQEDSLELLKTDGKNFEWNFAIQLLNEEDIEPWQFLLETNHFVRRDAVERLSKSESPAMKELFKKDQETFNAYFQSVIDAARAAGLQVGKRQGTMLIIENQGHELEFNYWLRNTKDVVSELLANFK